MGDGDIPPRPLAPLSPLPPSGWYGGDSLALAHAEAYARVLRSLRVGGVFSYAPALPFVEAVLPAKAYPCERVTLPEELLPPALIAAREDTGLDLA